MAVLKQQMAPSQANGSARFKLPHSNGLMQGSVLNAAGNLGD
jgi:hypothetical protein